MFKSIGVLGMLALLGGGTYVTVQSVCTQSPQNTRQNAAVKTIGDDCTMSPCCSESQAAPVEATTVEAPCPTDGPCPLEAQNQTTASVTPAPAPAAE